MEKAGCDPFDGPSTDFQRESDPTFRAEATYRNLEAQTRPWWYDRWGNLHFDDGTVWFPTDTGGWALLSKGEANAIPEMDQRPKTTVKRDR